MEVDTNAWHGKNKHANDHDHKSKHKHMQSNRRDSPSNSNSRYNRDLLKSWFLTEIQNYYKKISKISTLKNIHNASSITEDFLIAFLVSKALLQILNL